MQQGLALKVQYVHHTLSKIHGVGPLNKFGKTEHPLAARQTHLTANTPTHTTAPCHFSSLDCTLTHGYCGVTPWLEECRQWVLRRAAYVRLRLRGCSLTALGRRTSSFLLLSRHIFLLGGHTTFGLQKGRWWRIESVDISQGRLVLLSS